MTQKYLVSFLFLLCSTLGFAQFKVNSNDSASTYVKKVLMGQGLEVSNIRYTGYKKSIGTFRSVKNIIGLDSGLILSTGNAAKINGPNDKKNYTSSAGAEAFMLGDRDLRKAAKHPIYDMALLEFDFTPLNNHLSFNFVFASEEYPEYAGSEFNDVFCFFLREKNDSVYRNIALVPGTNIPIAVNTLNGFKNAIYFRNNNKEDMKAGKAPNPELMAGLEFDGLTKVLTAQCDVIPYKVYDMKIGIADAGDPAYDSGVFIQAGSFSSVEDPDGKYYDVLKEIKAKKIRFNPDSIFAAQKNPGKTTVKKEPEKTPDKVVEKTPVKTPQKTPEKPKEKKEPVAVEKKVGHLVIYFDTDKSQLKPKEKIKLDSILNTFGAKEFSRIELYGFTDSLGNRANNQKLAERRNVGVKTYLLSKGLSDDTVKTHQDEFLKEAETNATEKGRSRNRRVEVIFYRKNK